MRGSGILLHISSLPGPHGIGTFGKEAYDFVDFLEKAKQKYWQILPLAPTSYGDSPYQTLSAFAGNPYFIDFETLKAEGLLEEGDLQGLPRRNAGKVDYGLQFRFRFGVLKKAYLRFREDGPFRKFSETHSWWLDDYALFMALKAKHGHVSWEFWPDAYRFREQKAMGEFRKRAADEIGFWKFIQYKFFQQWEKLKKYANGKGIKIIGDIPIYVAYDSADVWCQPGYWQLDDALVPKAVAGVPPDGFTPDGQLWGIRSMITGQWKKMVFPGGSRESNSVFFYTTYSESIISAALSPIMPSPTARKPPGTEPGSRVQALNSFRKSKKNSGIWR